MKTKLYKILVVAHVVNILVQPLLAAETVAELIPHKFDASRGEAGLTSKHLSHVPLPKDPPDYDRAIGTLGGSSDHPSTRWRLATVIVRDENGWGSGALVSADGWIVSNYHVVESAAQRAALRGQPATLKIILGKLTQDRIRPSEPWLSATLYRADPSHDLALLKLDSLPEGVEELPHFQFGELAREGDDCFVIGHQSGGPAWWLRSAAISQEFDYPDELTDFSIEPASSRRTTTDRTRARIIISDARISGGDSGGPLLNAQGELIGITFATPENRTRGSVGWHIGGQHVRHLLAELPVSPERVPFDPWTAGLPGAAVVPRTVDADGDGTSESLVVRFFQSNALGNGLEQAAMGVFMRLGTGAEVLNEALLPQGLWGMEERGEFRFEVFVLDRIDGIRAIGYTDSQGKLDEVRVGRTADPSASVIWSRDAKDLWESKEAHNTRLLAADRLGSGGLLKTTRLWNRINDPLFQLLLNVNRVQPEEPGP